jgi:hypothetical protein
MTRIERVMQALRADRGGCCGLDGGRNVRAALLPVAPALFRKPNRSRDLPPTGASPNWS